MTAAEEEACKVVLLLLLLLAWGMRVPARRTATPGGGIRKAWVCVCVRLRVMPHTRTASTWRRDVVRLCMLVVVVVGVWLDGLGPVSVVCVTFD